MRHREAEAANAAQTTISVNPLMRPPPPKRMFCFVVYQLIPLNMFESAKMNNPQFICSSTVYDTI